MTGPSAAGSGDAMRTRLPRRDWLLFPALGLATVCVLACGAELAARRVFSIAGEGTKSCTVTDDPATGMRGLPNSVCWEKDLESRLTEYRFNGCGHRTAMDCGPKPNGVFRIVMIGSSFAAGAQVAEKESFAALLPGELSQRTGRSIEVYDAAIYRNGFPSAVAAQTGDALARQPDLIVLVITPWDIESAGERTTDAGSGGQAPALKSSFQSLVRTGSTSDLEQVLIFHSRLLFALRHYLYLSQSQYMRSYLKDAQNSSFLAANWSPQWNQDLSEYEAYFAQIEAKASAAGVPVTAVLIPNRAQATMISMGKWPPRYDPYKLGNELRAVITRHGATYIDILPDFRNVPNAQQYYMPVDGHPYPEGHALLAGIIARELVAADAPQLRAAASISSAPKKID